MIFNALNAQNKNTRNANTSVTQAPPKHTGSFNAGYNPGASGARPNSKNKQVAVPAATAKKAQKTSQRAPAQILQSNQIKDLAQNIVLGAPSSQANFTGVKSNRGINEFMTQLKHPQNTYHSQSQLVLAPPQNQIVTTNKPRGSAETQGPELQKQNNELVNQKVQQRVAQKIPGVSPPQRIPAKILTQPRTDNKRTGGAATQLALHKGSELTHMGFLPPSVTSLHNYNSHVPQPPPQQVSNLLSQQNQNSQQFNAPPRSKEQTNAGGGAGNLLAAAQNNNSISGNKDQRQVQRALQNMQRTDSIQKGTRQAMIAPGQIQKMQKPAQSRNYNYQHQSTGAVRKQSHQLNNASSNKSLYTQISLKEMMSAHNTSLEQQRGTGQLQTNQNFPSPMKFLPASKTASNQAQTSTGGKQYADIYGVPSKGGATTQPPRGQSSSQSSQQSNTATATGGPSAGIPVASTAATQKNQTQPMIVMNRSLDRKGSDNTVKIDSSVMQGVSTYGEQAPFLRNQKQSNTTTNNARQQQQTGVGSVRGYNVVNLGPQLTRSSQSQQKRRGRNTNPNGLNTENGGIVIGKTNFLAGGSGSSLVGENNAGGAILNIQTASDINIYNNSFIVKSSSTEKEQQKQASNRSIGKGQDQIQTKQSGQGQQSQKKISKLAGQKLVNEKVSGHPGGQKSEKSLTMENTQTAAHPQRSYSQRSSSQPRSLVDSKEDLKTAKQRVQALMSGSSAVQNFNQGQGSYFPGQKGKITQQSKLLTSKSQLRRDFSHSVKRLKNFRVSSEQSSSATAANQSVTQVSRYPQRAGPSLQGRHKNVSTGNSYIQKDLIGDDLKKGQRHFNNFVNSVSEDLQKIPNFRYTEEKLRQIIEEGKTKLQGRNYAEAVKLFTQVLCDIDGENAEATFYRALAYLDQGNLQQAISELWKVTHIVQSGADNGPAQFGPEAYILLSIAHKRLGEVQNSVQDLNSCVSEYPLCAEAFLARGQHYLQVEFDFKAALADFKSFNELNKNAQKSISSQPMSTKAAPLAKNVSLGQAIQPRDFMGFVGLADCFKALKQFDAARDAYSDAIKILEESHIKDPSSRKVMLQCNLKRALSSFMSKKYKEALKDFQTVVKQDKSCAKAHFYIGKILAKGVENDVSKHKDAILHFEQSAKHLDDEFYSGNALFQIAIIHLKNKDYFPAFHALNRAVDNNFTSKRLTLFKDFIEGVLYLIKRKVKKGIQILSDLLEILVNSNVKKSEETNSKKGGEKKKPFVSRSGSVTSSKNWQTDYLIFQSYVFRAYGYVAIEKYEQAMDDIRQVNIKFGRSDNATIYNKWLGKGILRMDHEDYLMASKYFQKAWRKFPTNKDPYLLQVISIVNSYSYSLAGYSMDQQIKYEKVRETKNFLGKAIRNCNTRKRESSLYFFRGLLNFQLHNFYDALCDFNSAISEDEEPTAAFYLARGRTYACLSILKEAMKDLSIALNLDQNLQQGYIFRGKCAYLLGDNNLAFLDFQQLILNDPKNPMVHILAGNLLMTTGAYKDAIKAFENADTVEPTAMSAFQRVRCYCALTDLNQALLLMRATMLAQPDDVILQYDNVCLEQLQIVLEQTSILSRGHRFKTQKKEQSEELDDAKEVLENAIGEMGELIKTYTSGSILKFKVKDAPLNLQLIPNVERIKVEKLQVAKDIAEAKANAEERMGGSQEDLDELDAFPSISVDADEPCDLSQLKNIDKLNYYYENIFTVEDMQLYRAVFLFYAGRYSEAVTDFQAALMTLKGVHGHSLNNKTNQTSLSVYGAANSLVSNKSDLSDVGMCSFNQFETMYNILLCYMFQNAKDKSIDQLETLSSKLPDRHKNNLTLLRHIIFEHFNMNKEAEKELKSFKVKEPNLYTEIFTKQKPFELEVFQVVKPRLCHQFAPVKFPPEGTPRKPNGVRIMVRPSFSMPFVKPPNMIPCVDEVAIQLEFNLKQIDAPMPEAPWVNRCAHGTIVFTETQKLSKIQSHGELIPDEKEDKKTSESISAKEMTTGERKLKTGLVSVKARLLDNYVSNGTIQVGQDSNDCDKINLSLLEEEDDSRLTIADNFREHQCSVECKELSQHNLKRTRPLESDQITDQPMTGDMSSANVTYSKQSMSQAFYRGGDDEEYEEEEDEDSDYLEGEFGTTEEDIDLIDRESLVNLGIGKALKPIKRTFHARQINKRGSKEPVGLDDKMLAGATSSQRGSKEKYARVKRERRISELNLSVEDSHSAAPHKLGRPRSEDSF